MVSYLYQQAKQDIIKMISGRPLNSTKKIKPERKLASELGYSRMTIKKALDSLAADGVLIRKQGAGTFIVESEKSNRFDLGDDSPFSLTQNIVLSGKKSTSFVESFKLVYDVPDLMHVFPDNFEFYELIRFREANNVIISKQQAYFPFRIFKDAHRYDFSQLSLYDYMEYKGKKPIKFRSNIKAIRVEDETLVNLGVKEGSHILLFEYFGYTSNNELVEYTRSYYNPSNISFKIEIDY